MSLTILDWAIILVFLVVIVGISLRYTQESGKNLESFFVGGRNLPWYLAGLSMVATTFAADTPLAVTELVGQHGIAGNWMWWSFLAGGMLTTFFFAKLWQRSGVLTEMEFIEFRYSGAAARFLRGFKAVYLGLLLNCIVIAWVNVAMQALLQVFFELDSITALYYTGAIMLLTAVYSSFSGLKGVAVTDAIQFVVAMVGCIILAFLVVNSAQIGGVTNLKETLIIKSPTYLDFFPRIQTSASDSSIVNALSGLYLPIGAFFAYIGVQWWASWYPGAEPGGGGYVVQRILSTPDEKQATYATLFFQIAHYCIRPWAWIMVGLCAIVLYDLPPADMKLGYVYAMRDFLPEGLRGLLLVAFLAAYMSTISTQLNWGASCLINDLYKRFLKPEQSDTHYVAASRIATLLLMVLGFIVSFFVNNISAAWGLLMQCGAGLGLVLILRWYWARINAWSEISATAAPFVATIYFHYAETPFPASFLLTVLFTTVVWLVVTMLTPRTDAAVLDNFYRKVFPQHIATTPLGNQQILDDSTLKPTLTWGKYFFLLTFVSWLSAIVLAYSILFLIGKIIFLDWLSALGLLGLSIGAGLVLRWSMSKTMA